MAPTHALQRPCRAWLAGAVLAATWAACSASGGASLSSLRAGSDAGEPVEIRVWRAGRGIGPGLPAARVAELEAERERALAALAHERGLKARLRAWLEGEDTGDELWCAAAGTAAALEFYELSSELGRRLEPSAGPRRAVAAREALHALYGRWFTRTEELAPFLESVSGGAGTRLLLDSIAWEEARSRERLLAELAHEPLEAAAWLADPDPRVRSGAARVLAQVFAREEADAGATLETLIAHLEGEHEPQAFHDGLLACLEPLERADAGQPASLRLRALLVEIARSGGEPRTLAASLALARLSWRMQGPRDLGHVLSGIDALGAMLRGLAQADRRRGSNDPDPLVAVLGALGELCEQAALAGLARELRAGLARESVLAVLQDSAQDEAVRAAAAAVLGPLARAGDGAMLAGVLRDPGVSALVKHALLGSLRSILPGLAGGEAGADELLGGVAALTGARDPDLRRRALALCADVRLEPLVARLDPTFLVERLEREDVPEATLELLRLIQRFGRAEMLGALLSLERFDALAGASATLDELCRALQRLARGSARDSIHCATRLAAGRAQETGLGRLRQALALVAQLDDASAFDLYPREHRAIAAWVWRSYRAGVAPREAAPSGLAFEQRLLEVHLPRGEKSALGEGAELGPFEEAHLSALLRADLFLGGVGRSTKPQVEAAFESAHQLALLDETRFLVLRDRARFRAAANECVKALSDYGRLLEAGSAADPLLGIPDLRSAVELLGRLEEAGGQGRRTAADACDILRRIVERDAWRAEPAAVRMQDLRDWARTGVESRDPERLRTIERALSDLPLTQLELETERQPSPLWLGLTREPGWFQELLDLRARVRLGLRELQAQG